MQLGRIFIWAALALIGVLFLLAGLNGNALAFLVGVLCMGGALMVRYHSPKPNTLDDLQRLGALRDTGVITPEEFNVRKAKLMKQD